MSSIDELLYRDFDGQSVRDPSAVIHAGLDDRRHEARVAPLAAITADAARPAPERLLAGIALASWAERTGYLMVVESARRPRAAPWYGCSVDRRYSVDDTFAGFATAVDISDEIADEKGTAGERIEALRALVRIADTEFFDDKLDYAIGEEIDAVAADLRESVDRGIRWLSAGHRPRFDLISQLVDLASVLSETAESDAIRLGHRLLELDHSPKVLRHAVAFVTRGSGEESLAFGEYLTLIGGEQIRAWVAEAVDHRARRLDDPDGPPAVAGPPNRS